MTAVAAGPSFSFLKVLPSMYVETTTGQGFYLRWTLYEVKKNAGNIDCTVLDDVILDPTVAQDTISSPSATERPMGPFAVDQWETVRPVPYDAGDAANTGYVDVFVNSVSGATMRICRLSPTNSVHPNSSGLDASTDCTSATGSKWHGIVVDGNASKKDTNWPPTLTGSGLDAKAFGGRFVRRNTVQSQPPQPDQADVVVFTRSRADAGTLGVDQTLTACTPTAPLTSTDMEAFEVQSCTFTATIAAINASPRNYVFAVDGVTCCIVDPVSKAVFQWPNVTTDATLKTYAITASHRGRIWLGRRSGAPNQWICSVQGNPTDFTTATPTATRSYSGSSTPEVGVPADAITCLAPFHDEYMVIGCSRSIYVLTGDPGYGGRISLIADTTGMLGPRAYCFDDVGKMYFMGSGGLYVMNPAVQGAFAFTNLSGRRLAEITDKIDYGTHLVQMAFDGLRSEVHVFITPRDGTQGKHIVLAVRTNALWIDTYHERDDGQCVIGPTAVRQIVGKGAEDRRFLLGGFDGFVRRPNAGARSDDGFPIISRVDMPILEAGGGGVELMLNELQLFGAIGSGETTWELWGGKSPAQVQARDRETDTPDETGTVWGENPGFDDSVGLRNTAGAWRLTLYMESASDAWALERAALETEETGRRRLN